MRCEIAGKRSHNYEEMAMGIHTQAKSQLIVIYIIGCRHLKFDLFKDEEINSPVGLVEPKELEEKLRRLAVE